MADVAGKRLDSNSDPVPMVCASWVGYWQSIPCYCHTPGKLGELFRKRLESPYQATPV
jgi:hypothetical protein